MREIKFRGKLIKSPEDWYYGSLARDIPNKSYYIIDEINGWVRDIIESTISQSTGLHDKNGIEIYEGDIVKIQGGHMEQGFYEWDEIKHIKNYIADTFDLFMTANQIGEKSLEVIGNIYDNPELIKED